MSTGPTHRFTYTPDPDNSYDHASVIVETNSVQLDNVLDMMERYLHVAGFSMAGRRLEVVDDVPQPATDPSPWSSGPPSARVADPLPPPDLGALDTDVPF